MSSKAPVCVAAWRTTLAVTVEMIIALTPFAALAIPVSLAAQDNAEPDHHHKYHHYQIIDPGTFGGPQGFLSFVGGLPRSGILNNRGRSQARRIRSPWIRIASTTQIVMSFTHSSGGTV